MDEDRKIFWNTFLGNKSKVVKSKLCQFLKNGNSRVSSKFLKLNIHWVISYYKSLQKLRISEEIRAFYLKTQYKMPARWIFWIRFHGSHSSHFVLGWDLRCYFLLFFFFYQWDFYKKVLSQGSLDLYILSYPSKIPFKSNGQICNCE